MAKQKIVFLERRVIEVPDGEDVVFEKGEAYALEGPSVERWLRRGAAVLEKDYNPEADEDSAEDADGENETPEGNEE